MTPTRSWLLVLLATATMAVSYVDRQAMAAVAPAMTHDLEMSDTMYGWLGSAFSMAYLVGAPLSGAVVDRLGARRALPAAVLVWTLVAGLHAVAPGAGAMFALRIALGAAESPSFPASAQILTRALPPERREAGMGVLFTGSSIGAALAAALVPRIAATTGWRGALLVTAVVGLMWLPAWFLITRDSHELLDGPVATTPSSHRTLLRNPHVWRATLAVVVAAPIIGLVLQWGAKLLVGRHGVAEASVGLYLWLPPLLFDLGAVGFGFAASQLRTTAAPPRALFASASCMLLAIVGLGVGRTPWETTLCVAIAIAGGGGVYTLATSEMLARVPSDQTAAASSLTAAAQSAALILAFPVIGRVLDATHDWGRVGVGLALLALPALVGWLLWRSPTDRALDAVKG